MIANMTEQCDFNFLKRKLDVTETDSIANDQQLNNESGNTMEPYPGTPHNVWKKRHIEDTANTDTNYFCGSGFSELTNSTGGHNANDATTTANSTDLAFNLIGSSLMNDLFTYDADAGGNGPTTEVTFTTPTRVNSTYDDGSNWHATDLLELDHRYNSTLQTEIAQLHATVSLKATAIDLANKKPHSTDQSTTQNDFLVPHKLIANRTVPYSKYREQQSLLVPQTSPTENEYDFEDKNLSWLLNFKFDEFPHLSPDLGATNNVASKCTSSTYSSNSNNNSSITTDNETANITNNNNNSSINNNLMQSSQNKLNPPNSPTSSTSQGGGAGVLQRSRSPKTSMKVGKKFEELVMEVTSELDGNDIMVAEHVVVEDSPLRTPKKPPFTYTELIEYALEDKGELTVSGIYQWISDRFPYYKSNDDRWKNSVRHNLSINPHFRKGVKAAQGAGHLWTISSGDSAENVLAWEHKKQRLDLFFKMETMNMARIQQHEQQMQQQLLQLHDQLQQHKPQQECTSPHQNCQREHCVFDEAAIAAAALTQEMLQQTPVEIVERQNCNATENHRLGTQLVNELPFSDLMSDEELRKTAGQILNGIHREVEVQSVNSVNSIIGTYHDVLLDNDYLNPIHKDVAMNEGDLRNTTTTTHAHTHHNSHSSSQYHAAEIDAMELGVHLAHQVDSDEVLFNDEFNLNYFGYTATNDIVA